MIPILLFDICNCDNVAKVFSSLYLKHPCYDIVKFQKGQGVKNINDFQLPEPWSGDIVNAPILFISSNPGYSNLELYPLLTWPKPIIADFFINRFKDRGPDYSWVYKSRLLNKNGTRGKSVRYWSSIKKRAEELLEREVIPGKDYCNTELVHCKSSDQIGVISALIECTDKFNLGITGISRAKLIIGVGSFVKTFFKGVSHINGIPIVYLPHPNARTPKTFTKLYTPVEIKNIRRIVDNKEFCQKKIEICDYVLPTDDEVKQFIDRQVALYNKGSI